MVIFCLLMSCKRIILLYETFIKLQLYCFIILWTQSLDSLLLLSGLVMLSKVSNGLFVWFVIALIRTKLLDALLNWNILLSRLAVSWYKNGDSMSLYMPVLKLLLDIVGLLVMVETDCHVEYSNSERWTLRMHNYFIAYYFWLLYSILN